MKFLGSDRDTNHCMIDGISAVDLMAVLMNPTVEEDFEPGPPWEPQESKGRGVDRR